jgi:molybdenum cofactor guanylyltransferase
LGHVSGLIAILAGGAGERLQRRKPLATLGGRPLIAHALAAARASGLDVIIVGKRSVTLPELGCEIVYEREQPRHPLCGVLAALAHAEQRAEQRAGGPPVVTVACDMPFLTGQLLAWLGAEPPLLRSAVARVDGRLQPLLGRYVPGDRPALARALRDGCSLTAAVLRLEPVFVEERELARFGDPQRLCFNVNSAEDLRLADAWLERPSQDAQARVATPRRGEEQPVGRLPGGRGDLGGVLEQL